MSQRRLTVFALVAGALMLLASGSAWLLTPMFRQPASESLSTLVPARFADWHEIRSAIPPVDPTVDRDAPRDMNNPYDDVLMRSYQDSHGNVVMLALAYGRNQRQEVKIHRPELCYVAQGFKLVSRVPVMMPAYAMGAVPVQGARMVVEAVDRVEAVSYWIRIGSVYSQTPWATRYYILKQGLMGHAIDGVLVRASQIVDHTRAVTGQLYEVQEKFLAELVGAMPPRSRELLVAEPGA
jgi:EpsI family protein